MDIQAEHFQKPLAERHIAEFEAMLMM